MEIIELSKLRLLKQAVRNNKRFKIQVIIFRARYTKIRVHQNVSYLLKFVQNRLVSSSLSA
jgi:hypothetical protein